MTVHQGNKTLAKNFNDEKGQTPMVHAPPAAERGRTQIDWLDSRHSFSFGDYQDPAPDGFSHTARYQRRPGCARPASACTAIATWRSSRTCWKVPSSTETASARAKLICRGDVQRMTAGTGIRHSEFNPSQTEPVHFLQVSIFPTTRRRHQPAYEHKHFPHADKRGRLQLIASPDARDGALEIHQDVDLFASVNSGRTSA